MQLISVDKKTAITLEEIDPRDPVGRYLMRVEIQPAAGGFSGGNDAVYFLNLAEFVNQAAAELLQLLKT